MLTRRASSDGPLVGCVAFLFSLAGQQMGQRGAPVTRRLLRSFRALAGLTQADIAQHVNRSRSWVCKVECGHRLPQRGEAEKIAAVLGVDVQVIFPRLQQ
jgi:DNA-binding XRE family transcriptional regulator